MADHMTVSHQEQEENSAILSQVDSILAQQVFKDALDKFNLLEELAPKIEQHKDQITIYVGKEIEDIIKKQEALESQFQAQIQKRDEAVSQGRSREELRKLNEEVSKLALEIQNSTKNLCKNLKENPSVTENLGKTQQHRNEYKEFIEKAYHQLESTGSYHELEQQIAQRYQILQEHGKLKESEQNARNQVQTLKKEIDDMRHDHEQKMKQQKDDLDKTKEDLLYEKDRVDQCLALLKTQLCAATDEMSRVREVELAYQRQRMDNLLEQIKIQQETDKKVTESVARQCQEMSDLATEWAMKKENFTKALEAEKLTLERKLEEKKAEITRLEAQVMANRAEKKDWVERTAFRERMEKATLEARKMRVEASRLYIQDTFRFSLCVPAGRGQKNPAAKKDK